MAELGMNRKRFTSPWNAMATSAAQQLLMKPALWSILTVHVHGTEFLDGVEEPFISIANHSSHFDGPLIIGALPRRLSRNIATGAAADTFFTKRTKAIGVELFMNAFPVNRGATRSHRGMAKQLLSEGVPLFIFPEGTRSRTGGMGPFRPGVAALAISFDCQVIPAAIVGAHAAWPPTDKRWKPGRPEVHIAFGLPMRPRPGEIAHQFSERLRRKVIELHDSTATAYDMPTQMELAHRAALTAAPSKEEKAKAKEAAEREAQRAAEEAAQSQANDSSADLGSDSAEGTSAEKSS